MLKQEKLSLEAEALRARYEAMLNSLEKATTREPSSSMQTLPSVSRVNLRHSMHASDNGRQKGEKREREASVKYIDANTCIFYICMYLICVCAICCM